MLLTTASNRSLSPSLEPSTEPAMVQLKHKRASVNGVNLHYVTVGSGPAVLCLHGWPQNHREFLPFFETCSNSYRFIAPDLRGYADSDKPYTDYLPATIAQDMLELADVEGAGRFHILSHDLGGPPSVALAYMAGERALSLATIETPFFGLDYPGYNDPRVAYWHLGMHANMDIARFLIEGREEQYLRHFFRDFAYNPSAIPEEDVRQYAMQMKQPGNLRASLNHYGFIPEKSAQLAELAKNKLTIPVMAWGGRSSFACTASTAQDHRLTPKVELSMNVGTGSLRKRPTSSWSSSAASGESIRPTRHERDHAVRDCCNRAAVQDQARRPYRLHGVLAGNSLASGSMSWASDTCTPGPSRRRRSSRSWSACQVRPCGSRWSRGRAT